MKTRHLIPLLISTLFIAACKKDPPLPESPEPVMPPLTHQGLNTFGCYIDGELFVAGGADSYWDLPSVSGSFNEENNRIGIQGTRYLEGDKSAYVTLISYEIDGLGEFDFGPFLYDDIIAYQDLYSYRCDYYYHYPNNTESGKLNITYFNKIERIISGTFYMNLINQDCEGDTLMKITDGRFDFRY